MRVLAGVRIGLRATGVRPHVGHLHDRRLLDVLDGHAAAGDRIHLQSCRECTERLAELRVFLDGLRNAAAAGDEALSPARLRAARRRIMRRVERAATRGTQHRHAHARVLRFPGAARTKPAVAHRSRWWMAAAAVAGLVAGVAVGRLDPRPFGGEAGPGPSAAAASAVAAERTATGGGHAADEQFMQELERALTSPRIPPLAALDELTPRPYEVAVDVR